MGGDSSGLTRRERRALRRLERDLRADDPEWVARFAPTDAAAARMSGARACAAFLAVALALILAGAALHATQMVVGGVLVLGLLPVLVLLVLAGHGY